MFSSVTWFSQRVCIVRVLSSRVVRIAKFDKPFALEFVATDSTLSKFYFESSAATNKKIPKHFMIMSFTDGKLKKLPYDSTLLTPNQFAYQLKPKSVVVDKRTDGVAEL